jgi:hypothetical protein
VATKHNEVRTSAIVFIFLSLVGMVHNENDL